MKRGVFITLEGVEGCGKSTQLRLLQERLSSQGRDVFVTREPGGPHLSEVIRGMLLDPANEMLDDTAELFLYEAARAQHVAEQIRPALERGAVVLCDRFADSTTAYQGAGRGMDVDQIKLLHRMATRGVWPDLTVLIDLPIEIGLARAAQSGKRDRIEQEPAAFHERVRQGFLALAREEPGRIRVVDGLRPVDSVAQDIARLVDEALAGR